jgi:glucose/arabinose dehydrogenase
LAPVAPPPVPTATDKLPLDKLKVKNGFKIELYAAGVPNARSLRRGAKGTVFVSSRLQDKIHAIVEKDGKREVKVIASGLHRPNGIVLHKGTLYIAELSQISKIDNIEDNLDNPPKPTVILSDLPKDEAHGWKYLTVGPDEKLYFHIGAPCNICMPPERHAKIYRVGLDGKDLEVYATGIRLSPVRTTSAIPIATRATCPIPSSVGDAPAASSPSRWPCWAPTPRPWV